MAVPLPLVRLKRMLCASSSVVYGMQWSMSLALRIVVAVRSSWSGLHSATIGLSPACSHLLKVKNAHIEVAWSPTSTCYGQDGRTLNKRWRLAVSHGELVPYLTYTCRGQSLNKCVSVEGSDTKRSESYSEDFASLVLHALLAQRRGSL